MILITWDPKKAEDISSAIDTHKTFRSVGYIAKSEDGTSHVTLEDIANRRVTSMKFIRPATAWQRLGEIGEDEDGTRNTDES